MFVAVGFCVTFLIWLVRSASKRARRRPVLVAEGLFERDQIRQGLFVLDDAGRYDLVQLYLEKHLLVPEPRSRKWFSTSLRGQIGLTVKDLHHLIAAAKGGSQHIPSHFQSEAYRAGQLGLDIAYDVCERLAFARRHGVDPVALADEIKVEQEVLERMQKEAASATKSIASLGIKGRGDRIAQEFEERIAYFDQAAAEMDRLLSADYRLLPSRTTN